MLSADPATLAAFEAQNPDAAGIMQRKAVTATFYREAVYDKEASEGFTDFRYDPTTGREIKVRVPGAGTKKFRDEIFVEISMPGNTLEKRNRPIRESDKLRFAPEWAAFERQDSAPPAGTPLSSLPFLSKVQVLEFAAAGCKTAEQLAQVSDQDGQKFMAFQQLRRRVQDFLAAAAGNAPLLEMRKELESRDAEMAALREQVAALAKEKGLAPKRRGRPPKAKAPEVEAPRAE